MLPFRYRCRHVSVIHYKNLYNKHFFIYHILISTTFLLLLKLENGMINNRRTLAYGYDISTGSSNTLSFWSWVCISSSILLSSKKIITACGPRNRSSSSRENFWCGILFLPFFSFDSRKQWDKAVSTSEQAFGSSSPKLKVKYWLLTLMLGLVTEGINLFT